MLGSSEQNQRSLRLFLGTLHPSLSFTACPLTSNHHPHYFSPPPQLRTPSTLSSTPLPIRLQPRQHNPLHLTPALLTG
eukprot:2958740-Rhodomonas_salina.3